MKYCMTTKVEKLAIKTSMHYSKMKPDTLVYTFERPKSIYAGLKK